MPSEDTRRLGALASVLRSAHLRRLLIAYSLFSVAEFAVWIAMLVFAFQQGGTTEASAVAVAQLVPAAILAAGVGAIAARHGVARTLKFGYVLQALGMAVCSATILLDGSKFLAYMAAIVAATAVTLTRPCQAAITPSLVPGAESLTATNVVSSWIESGSMLAGPALAGVLLGAGGAGAVFASMAGCAVAAALLTVGLPEPAGSAAIDEEVSGRELIAVMASVIRAADVRACVGIITLGAVVIGALDVLYVVLAEDRLHLSEGGPGFLNSAFGAGSVAGGLLAVTLIGRRRLAPALSAAILASALALAAIGATHSTAPIVGLLVLCGIARTVLDTAARTLLQRVSTLDVVAHIFAAVESITMAGLAIGSFTIPLIVRTAGATWAPVGISVIVLVMFALTIAPIRRIDRTSKSTLSEVALLRRLPLFHGLGSPALETLAREGAWLLASPGEVVIREGDFGDRYYAIAEGSVDFNHRGARLRTLSGGEGFGEIALIHDVPRTASAIASSPTRLFAIGREPFLIAVTGSAAASLTAQSIVRERLAANPPPHALPDPPLGAMRD